MRILAFSVLLITSLVASLLASPAPEPKTAAEAFARHLFVHTESPRYAYELRKRGVRGSGVFEMEFDYESGRVREVRIIQSTGQRDLDRDTVIALRRWRATPRSVHILRLPVTFGSNV